MLRGFQLQELTDDELVAALGRLATQRNRVSAALVAHIGELDARRLYAKHACSSTFSYCEQRLHLSVSTTCKAIAVARLARRFPLALEMLHDGETHMSNLVLLAPHLTDENHQALLAAAKHKSKRDVELLLAEWFPRPAVSARIRKLPTPRRVPVATAEPGAPVEASGNALVLTPAPAKPAKVEPLAPTRFRFEFTGDRQLYDDVEEAKALLGPRHQGELGALFGQAMRQFVETLKKKKYAKTSRPKKAKSRPDADKGAKRSRHVPNEVKREIAERDALQCSFVDEDGNRCQERWGLEIHHEGVPFARGGPHTTQNGGLMCKAHNRYRAEQEYGADFIAEKIAEAQQSKRPTFPGECSSSPSRDVNEPRVEYHVGQPTWVTRTSTMERLRRARRSTGYEYALPHPWSG